MNSEILKNLEQHNLFHDRKKEERKKLFVKHLENLRLHCATLHIILTGRTKTDFEQFLKEKYRSAQAFMKFFYTPILKINNLLGFSSLKCDSGSGCRV